MVTTSCFYIKTSLAHLLACSWADTTWHNYQKFSCSCASASCQRRSMLFLGRIKQVTWSDTNWMISFKSYTRTSLPYRHYRSPSHYLMWFTSNSCILFLTLASSHHCTLMMFFQVHTLHRALCSPAVKLTFAGILLTIPSSLLGSSRRLNLPGLDRLFQGWWHPALTAHQMWE